MPRISQLPAKTTPASGDEIAIVEVATSTTKKITRADLLKGADLPNDTVTTGAIKNGAVTTAKIADKAVTADKIDFSTLTLAYAERTTGEQNFNTYNSNKLSITATVSTKTNVWLEISIPNRSINTGAGNSNLFILKEGATEIMRVNSSVATGSSNMLFARKYISMTAGAHTYTLEAASVMDNGTAYLEGSSTRPFYLRVSMV